MCKEEAISEIIGAILLIGVLVGSFGIFAAIYLPTLQPVQVPHVKLSMACNETIGADDVEFPCIRGSFQCHPFDNRTCEDNCIWKDYSENPEYKSEHHSQEVSRCMENCLGSICSDLVNCGALYVCHNGGDSLTLSGIRILVNGIPTEQTSWGVKQQMAGDIFISPPTDGILFRNGDSIRISNPSAGQPVDSVMILYSLPSGGEVTLAMNQFGTDVD
jgi:hypothetical protein